jgi:hypothetical protein
MAIRVTGRVFPTTSHPMRRAGDIVIDKAADGAALTPTEPVARTAPAYPRSHRPDASFLVHLIATAEQVPQTRVLRRAEIADVQAAYRNAAGAFAAGAATNRVTRLA